MFTASMEEALTWEDTYEIVRALREQFPSIKIEEVSLGMILHMTLALPQFHDDPELANDAILSEIYREWYEEVNPL